MATVDLIAGEATLPKRKKKTKLQKLHQAHVKLMSSRLVAAKLRGRPEAAGKAMLYL
jgi:hypothetical protein